MQYNFPKIRGRGGVKGCLELFRKFIYFGRGRRPLSIIIIYINLSNLDVVNVNYSSDISNSLEERSKAQEGILNYLLRCRHLHLRVVILILSVAQEQQEEREQESEPRHFIDVYLAEMEKNPKDFTFEELCRCISFLVVPSIGVRMSVYFQTLSTLTHV